MRVANPAALIWSIALVVSLLTNGAALLMHFGVL